MNRFILIILSSLLILSCRLKGSGSEVGGVTGYVMPSQASFEQGLNDWFNAQSYQSSQEFVLTIVKYTPSGVDFTVMLKDMNNDVDSLALASTEATLKTELELVARDYLKDREHNLNYSAAFNSNLVLGTVFYQMPAEVDLRQIINDEIGKFKFKVTMGNMESIFIVKEKFNWILDFSPSYNRGVNAVTAALDVNPSTNPNGSRPTQIQKDEMQGLVQAVVTQALVPDVFGNILGHTLVFNNIFNPY